MSELEIYGVSGSQPSWRVLLACEIKKIPYQLKTISLSAGDNKTPGFLAMNPRHKVPVIKDGEYVLYESVPILAYLESKYPQTPLFGSNPEQTGLIWRRISEFQCYAEPSMEDNLILPFFFGKSEERRDAIEAALPALHEELKILEAVLADQDWLVGDSLSAADVVIFPDIMCLRRAAQKPAAQNFDLGVEPFEQIYPNMNRWLARVERLPGYDKTYPPHWRAGP